MADGMKIKIDGLAELETKLMSMGQDVAAKNIVSTAFSANKVLADTIKAKIISNESVDTGLLVKSIRRKKIVYGKSGTVVVVTGISKSVKGVDKDGKPRVPWRYAHIVEKRKPFLQPSYSAVSQQVVDDFVSKIKQKIERYERAKQ